MASVIFEVSTVVTMMIIIFWEMMIIIFWEMMIIIEKWEVQQTKFLYQLYREDSATGN
jgi:hypothetical protein